ncbi:hypothetical protein [Paenibacillus wynnii]|uniref:hypothetical protein n=1 Tax=Paenibacillus wynnii TaxID=268407 RepID=UPI00278E76D5|nr:hypothetical protein [Paenibacillus wynnii]MDQ0196594.1 hypothetical protein [Paenibacillus wynnii]
MNSVEEGPNNTLLISMRNMWAIYNIDKATDPGQNLSYRAFKNEWVGLPLDPPSIAVDLIGEDGPFVQEKALNSSGQVIGTSRIVQAEEEDEE